ncbi:MAG: hypothetical protein V4510_07585 [bacterium]
MNARSWSCIAACLLVAGCAVNRPGTVGSASGTSNLTSAPIPEPSLTNTSIWTAPLQDSGIVFNGCDQVETGMPYPGNTSPAHPPGNWTGAVSSGGAGTDFYLWLVACQRVHIGPFERPLRMIIEHHDNMTTPSACRTGNWNYFSVLNAIYVDDDEVAAWMRREIGMPAHHADIHHDVSPGKISKVSWSWTPDGGQTSDTTLTQVNDHNASDGFTYRIVWVNAGKLVMWHFTTTEEVAQPPPGIIPGHMRSPMLPAKYGEFFPGLGQYESHIDYDGRLIRFNDEWCKEPIDPYP